AIRIDPKNVRWLNARGFFLFTRGKRDAALRDLDAAIVLDDGNSEALNNRGLLRVGQQDYKRAIADFSKAIEADAKFADAWNNRGFAHFRSDKHAKALADFDTALACDPKFVMAYNNRALLRIARKEYRQAVADCSSAIELSGDNPRFYQLRREAYRRLGKSKEALADSEKLAWLIKYQRLSRRVASDPRKAGGYIQRARHLAQEGRSGAALADYQRAIKVDPNQANEAYLARARYWIVQKDWKRATVDCSRALEAGGGFAAWSLRGEAHMHQGHWDLAIADFVKARRFDTVVAGVYAKRAAVHESAGRKVEAAADRKRAAELDPERFGKTP
ncbi:MAG: tetratricopeptide repeat protein, partial [Planctomycetota bacterium]|nr:tetratricopeptide repeat protein [Planctomycetota bacterium]